MFASTVRKDGQSAAPKVVPRRNVVRKHVSAGTVDVGVTTLSVDATQDRLENQSPVASATAAVVTAQNETLQPLVLEHSQQLSQPRLDAALDTIGTFEVSTGESLDATTVQPVRVPREALQQDGLAPSSAPITREASQTQDQEETRHETSTPRSHTAEATEASGSMSTSNGLLAPQPARDRALSEVSHATSATEEFDSVTARLKNLQHNLRRAGRASQPYYRLPSVRTPRLDTVVADSQDSSDSRPRKRRRKNTIQDQVDAIVANATRSHGRGRSRAVTPDDAETRVLHPSTTTMGDLVSRTGSKLGKKSSIEKAMTENWPQILRRRKEEAAARLKAAQDGRRKRGGGNLADDAPPDIAQEQQVVQQVIENGQIVVVNREIDRAAQLQASAQLIREDEIQDDELIYRRVNQSTIGSKQQIAPGSLWDDRATDLFYQGMTMFGTDFKMISNMIPGKNRRQVKLKYNVEEKTNWERIKRCLGRRKEVELDKYAEMTGIEFQSAEEVYRQMAEDEKALRDADEQRRRDEGIISKKPADSVAAASSTAGGERAGTTDQTGPADTPMPSIERSLNSDQAAVPATHPGETERGTATAAAAAAADLAPASRPTTAAASAAPKKKAQRKRKVDKYGGGGQEYFEGVEERVGDVGSVNA